MASARALIKITPGEGVGVRAIHSPSFKQQAPTSPGEQFVAITQRRETERLNRPESNMGVFCHRAKGKGFTSFTTGPPSI